jgi:hypothetical protein
MRLDRQLEGKDIDLFLDLYAHRRVSLAERQRITSTLLEAHFQLHLFVDRGLRRLRDKKNSRRVNRTRVQQSILNGARAKLAQLCVPPPSSPSAGCSNESCRGPPHRAAPSRPNAPLNIEPRFQRSADQIIAPQIRAAAIDHPKLSCTLGESSCLNVPTQTLRSAKTAQSRRLVVDRSICQFKPSCGVRRAFKRGVTQLRNVRSLRGTSLRCA